MAVLLIACIQYSFASTADSSHSRYQFSLGIGKSYHFFFPEKKLGTGAVKKYFPLNEVFVGVKKGNIEIEASYGLFFFATKAKVNPSVEQVFRRRGFQRFSFAARSYLNNRFSAHTGIEMLLIADHYTGRHVPSFGIIHDDSDLYYQYRVLLGGGVHFNIWKNRLSLRLSARSSIPFAKKELTFTDFNPDLGALFTGEIALKLSIGKK